MGNPQWIVYRILSIPADAANEIPYTYCAWCVFESLLVTAGVGARQLVAIKDEKIVGTEPSPVAMTPTRFAKQAKELHFRARRPTQTWWRRVVSVSFHDWL